jgi:hypothetical protein
MARRPDREKVDILSEKDLRDLRHNLAHLSLGAVRDFYDQAYRDCRLIYSRLPSPRQMQTLVQVWKQLRSGDETFSSTSRDQLFNADGQLAHSHPGGVVGGCSQCGSAAGQPDLADSAGRRIRS